MLYDVCCHGSNRETNHAWRPLGIFLCKHIESGNAICALTLFAHDRSSFCSEYNENTIIPPPFLIKLLVSTLSHGPFMQSQLSHVLPNTICQSYSLRDNLEILEKYFTKLTKMRTNNLKKFRNSVNSDNFLLL